MPVVCYQSALEPSLVFDREPTLFHPTYALFVERLASSWLLEYTRGTILGATLARSIRSCVDTAVLP